MEKLFLTLVLFWFSVCSFAEDYSFSVIKSGIGKKSVILFPALRVRETSGRRQWRNWEHIIPATC